MQNGIDSARLEAEMVTTGVLTDLFERTGAWGKVGWVGVKALAGGERGRVSVWGV